jgi:hypothetical protein
MEIEADNLAHKRILINQSPYMHACTIHAGGKCYSRRKF